MIVLAFSRHTGVRVAEIGFALIAAAGVLLAVAQLARFRRTGAIAGGVALAAGAALVIVAIRWGSFGAFF